MRNHAPRDAEVQRAAVSRTVQHPEAKPGGNGWRRDLLLSLLFLAATLAMAPGGLWTSHPPIPFGSEQTNIAHALAAATAWVPPLWPGMLALIYRCCGADTVLSSRVIIGLQHLLVAFSLFALLRSVAGSSTWPKRLSLVALFALLANLPIRTLALIEADDVWIVWALLASLLWLCTGKRWSTSRLAGFSILGTLCVLTHAGAGLAFLVTTGVCVFAGRRQGNPAGSIRRPPIVARLLLVYLGAGLALTGWTWRNYLRFHTLIPVKSTQWFELGLTLLPPGHSGVLSESDLLLRHPFLNPAINAHLAAVGEAAFMDEQRRAVMQALRRHPEVLLRQIWHRAVDALAYAEPLTDAATARAELPAGDWRQLQKAGLICNGPEAGGKTWIYLGRPAGEALRQIAALPLQQKAAAQQDWVRNATGFRIARSRWQVVGTGLLYGALPTLCLCWGLWRRQRARLAVLPYACLAYLAVLVPHILVTHYFLHQLRFVPLQAALIAAAGIDLGGVIAARRPRTASPRGAVSASALP
jgi:hypothetical protein